MGFIHEHIILPLSDLLEGERVYHYMRLLREAEQWDEAQMRAFQQKKLRELIIYASKNVPYYHDWFHDHNLDPQSAPFDQLPIVNKAIIRHEGIDRFTAEHFPAKKRISSRSSGSIGEPFSFYESKLSYSVNLAAKLRTWYKAGYRLGDPYMKIANGVRSSKIKKLQDRFNNCFYKAFYSINEESLKMILDEVEEEKPRFIRSYPAPLFLLAQYRNTHQGYQHRPIRVFTTGSTLSQTYREEIERAFGCDVIDSYSCEGTPNTYETPAHDGYRISGYYGIIEVLDDNNRPVIDGIGRVVSTDFWNLAHPFIRYDTQDLVEVKGGRIIRIMGRQCETLIEADGKLLTVHNFTHYFSDKFPSVDGWQVVKRKDGNICFRLVVNDLFSDSDRQRIVSYWSSCTGRNIIIEVVDKLPLLANNKHLSIIDET